MTYTLKCKLFPKITCVHSFKWPSKCNWSLLTHLKQHRNGARTLNYGAAAASFHRESKSKMHSFIWLPSRTNHFIFRSVAWKPTFTPVHFWFTQNWKRLKGRAGKRVFVSPLVFIAANGCQNKSEPSSWAKAESRIPSGTTRWGLSLSSRLLSRLRLTSNLWLCYIRINYRYFPPKWVTLTKTQSTGNLAPFAD